MEESQEKSSCLIRSNHSEISEPDMFQRQEVDMFQRQEVDMFDQDRGFDWKNTRQFSPKVFFAKGALYARVLQLKNSQNFFARGFSHVSGPFTTVLSKLLDAAELVASVGESLIKGFGNLFMLNIGDALNQLFLDCPWKIIKGGSKLIITTLVSTLLETFQMLIDPNSYASAHMERNSYLVQHPEKAHDWYISQKEMSGQEEEDEFDSRSAPEFQKTFKLQGQFKDQEMFQLQMNQDLPQKFPLQLQKTQEKDQSQPSALDKKFAQVVGTLEQKGIDIKDRTKMAAFELAFLLSENGDVSEEALEQIAKIQGPQEPLQLTRDQIEEKAQQIALTQRATQHHGINTEETTIQVLALMLEYMRNPEGFEQLLKNPEQEQDQYVELGLAAVAELTSESKEF